MPYIRTPQGITPPAPGLDREEPTFVNERDIPSEDHGNARPERNTSREERTPRKPERE